jgi:hypothetical protein
MGMKSNKTFRKNTVAIDGTPKDCWSLTLKERHRLRVFEIRVLRRIFGPKRDEMTEGLRKLHNEELRDW